MMTTAKQARCNNKPQRAHCAAPLLSQHDHISMRSLVQNHQVWYIGAALHLALAFAWYLVLSTGSHTVLIAQGGGYLSLNFLPSGIQ
jgi:hypothetical protein